MMKDYSGNKKMGSGSSPRKSGSTTGNPRKATRKSTGKGSYRIAAKQN